MAVSHNLSKLLVQKYDFSLLRLHLHVQSVSARIYSCYLLFVVNSPFPGTLG